MSLESCVLIGSSVTLWGFLCGYVCAYAVRRYR